MNIILIIIVFGVIVFVHELGHFIVAKLNNVLVTEFSIGMGPAIFSVQKKETKYSLRLLPFGGYCLMAGEEEETDDERGFNNKPVWVRMLVVLAGPFFNFVLAFIFSIILIHYTGCDPARLYNVVEDSPAMEAGITAGDTILEINGDRIYNFRELQLFMAINNPKEPFELTLQKENGEVYTTSITPAQNEGGSYVIGVVSGNIRAEGIPMTLKYSVYECRYWVKSTFLGLKMIVTGGVQNGDIMGPVGVGEVMNDIIEEVKTESTSDKEVVINIILNLINWCILLSVNLGIMNLLPIPALDGGRFLFLIIEAVRRKKIPQEKEAIVNFIGFVFMIGLMVVVFFNDIKNLFLS